MTELIGLLPSIAEYGISAIIIVLLLWVVWRLLMSRAQGHIDALMIYGKMIEDLHQMVEDYDNPNHLLRMRDLIRTVENLNERLSEISDQIDSHCVAYDEFAPELRKLLSDVLSIIKQFALDADRTRQETRERIAQIELHVRDATQDNKEIVRELLAITREFVGRGGGFH